MRYQDYKTHNRLMQWSFRWSTWQFIKTTPALPDYWDGGVKSFEMALKKHSLSFVEFMRNPKWQEGLLFLACKYELAYSNWGRFLLAESGALKDENPMLGERWREQANDEQKGILLPAMPQECILCTLRIKESELFNQDGSLKPKILCLDCSSKDQWTRGLARDIRKAYKMLMANTENVDIDFLWSFYGQILDKYLEPEKSYTTRARLLEPEDPLTLNHYLSIFK